jgi:AcrR family transcriptional regulator
MSTRKTTAKKKTPRRPRSSEARKPARVRVAQQDRGQQRIDDILDAAERVITKVGVDQASVNAIAREAGSGMGSLYHFFPHKEAIVLALAERYADRMRPLTLFGERPEMAKLSIADMVDAIIDPMAEFFRSAPAYLHVYHATNKPGAPSLCDTEMQEVVVHHVETLMRWRVPKGDPAKLRVSAMVAVEFVHALMGAAFASPPAARAAMIIETKRLLAIHSEMLQKGDDPLVRLR